MALHYPHSAGPDIFGVVTSVLPLITSGLPKFMKVLETFRNTNSLKEESLENISSLFAELKVTFAILQQLHRQSPRILESNQGIAYEFRSLFRGFPETVKRLRAECENLSKKSTIGFLLTFHRIEETVQELEHQIQRLFRRLTLLVTYLQRVVPNARYVIRHSGGAHVHGHNRRPSQIRELLKAQHNLPKSEGPQTRFRFRELGRSVGDFAIWADLHSENRLVVVETCTFRGQKNVDRGEKASREVVRKLSVGSSSDWLGILACRTASWISRDQKTSSAQLTIIYRYPAMADHTKVPLTLRSILRHDDDSYHPRVPDVPLRVRLRLAREVSNAVLFVHVASLVHKDIRPENILIFFPRHRSSESIQDNGMTVGKAFLTGFGESRMDPSGGADMYHAHSHSTGGGSGYSFGGMRTTPQEFRALSWYQNMYRHPSRVGPTPARFTMRHDIYALGVTLLEIGLWRSFVGTKEHAVSSRSYPAIYLTHKPLWIFKGKIPHSERAIQSTLLTAARQLLPCAMGETYTSIVLSCLTCLEQDQGRLGSEEGACAMFIEHVLDRLDYIKF